jgi:hypothetical protein
VIGREEAEPELIMNTGTQISALYHEFTEALTEVLAENAVGPARRGRLARVHTVLKNHPDRSEGEYFLAVETAFAEWETFQNAGRWSGQRRRGEDYGDRYLSEPDRQVIGISRTL